MISGTSATSAFSCFAQALELGERRDVRLMLPGEEVRERGGIATIASNGPRHFRRGQADVEHLQVVDQSVLEAAVAKARADRERVRVRRSSPASRR